MLWDNWQWQWLSNRSVDRTTVALLFYLFYLLYNSAQSVVSSKNVVGRIEFLHVNISPGLKVTYLIAVRIKMNKSVTLISTFSGRTVEACSCRDFPSDFYRQTNEIVVVFQLLQILGLTDKPHACCLRGSECQDHEFTFRTGRCRLDRDVVRHCLKHEVRSRRCRPQERDVVSWSA